MGLSPMAWAFSPSDPGEMAVKVLKFQVMLKHYNRGPQGLSREFPKTMGLLS